MLGVLWNVVDLVHVVAGAVMGAKHGSAWIPRRWWDNLEEGEHGKYHVLSTALQLADLDLQDYSAPPEEG